MESVLFRKSITFNGDSICAGDGTPGGYAKIIAERNEMVYENIAVCGATVVSGQYSKRTGNPRHWICRTIERMNADADYAIVEGGVNDASINVGDPDKLPIGKLSEGYDAELDDTTFYGAFESMLKALVKRFAGKKYGYIAVHQMAKKFSPCYEGEDNFYVAAKRCCAKWGVPFCDITSTCPPLAFFKKSSDPELIEIGVSNTKGDGWHPNEIGYKRYYCDKIEAWLKTL